MHADSTSKILRHTYTEEKVTNNKQRNQHPYRDVHDVAHAINIHHASLLGISCEVLQIQMPLDLLVPVLKYEIKYESKHIKNGYKTSTNSWY